MISWTLGSGAHALRRCAGRMERVGPKPPPGGDGGAAEGTTLANVTLTMTNVSLSLFRGDPVALAADSAHSMGWNADGTCTPAGGGFNCNRSSVSGGVFGTDDAPPSREPRRQKNVTLPYLLTLLTLPCQNAHLKLVKTPRD